MTTRSACCLAQALACGLLSSAAVAHAAPDARAAHAEKLFQEAKSLMNEGRVAEACPKLEQARTLDGGGGTVLALALCHEREGRLATALGEFREALQLARDADRQDRAELAATHLKDLQASVPRLAISTERVAAPELELEIDGRAWPRERWNEPWPVDPGLHQLVARAGQQHFEAPLELRAGSGETRFEVPAWSSATPEKPAAVPKPASREMPEAPTPRRSSTRRTVAWSLGGVGVAGIVIGSFYGVRAIQLRSDAEDACGGPRCKDERGVQLDKRSSNAGLVSTVAFSVAGAAAAASAWLFLTQEPDAPVQVGALPTPSGLSLVASGRF